MPGWGKRSREVDCGEAAGSAAWLRRRGVPITAVFVPQYVLGCFSNASAVPQVVHLFNDMSARDLVQRRTTTLTGDTVWENTPLVTACLEGRIAVLDGIERLAPGTLNAVQRLLQVRDPSPSCFSVCLAWCRRGGSDASEPCCVDDRCLYGTKGVLITLQCAAFPYSIDFYFH